MIVHATSSLGYKIDVLHYFFRIKSLSGRIFHTADELKVLDLYGNDLQEIGLADLKGLVSLQNLDISHNNIKQVFTFRVQCTVY